MVIPRLGIYVSVYYGWNRFFKLDLREIGLMLFGLGYMKGQNNHIDAFLP